MVYASREIGCVKYLVLVSAVDELLYLEILEHFPPEVGIQPEKDYAADVNANIKKSITIVYQNRATLKLWAKLVMYCYRIVV